jgi:hypothetical protein
MKGFTPQQIEQFVKIADVIRSVAELVNIISSSGKNMPEIKVEGGAGLMSMVKVQMQLPDITKVLDGFGEKFGELIGKVKDVADSMPSGVNGADFEKKIGIVKGLFELLKMVPEIASAAKDVSKRMIFGIEVQDTSVIGTSIGMVTTYLDGLVNTSGEGLPKLINVVKKVNEFLGKAGNGRESIDKMVTRVKGFFEGVSGLVSGLSSIKDIMGNLETPKKIDANDFPILGIISSFLPKEKQLDPLKGQEPEKHPLAKSLDDLTQLLDVIGPSALGLAVSIDWLGSFITNTKKIVDKVKGLTEYFSAVKGFAQVINDFKDNPSGVNAQTGTTIGTEFDNIANAISNLGLSNIGSALETALSSIPFEKLANVQKRMSKLSDFMVNMSSSLTHMKNIFKAEDLAKSLGDISAIVSKVYELNASLQSVQLGKIETAMKPKGATLVNDKGQITIKTAAANFHIDLKISLGAKDIEQAILVDSKSVIVDYLNALGGNPDKKMAKPVHQQTYGAPAQLEGSEARAGAPFIR